MVTVASAMNGIVNIHTGFNSQIVLSFLGTVLYRISKWPTHLRVAVFDHACSFGINCFNQQRYWFHETVDPSRTRPFGFFFSLITHVFTRKQIQNRICLHVLVQWCVCWKLLIFTFRQKLKLRKIAASLRKICWSNHTFKGKRWDSILAFFVGEEKKHISYWTATSFLLLQAAQQRREDKIRAEKERIMQEDDPERQRRLEVCNVQWIWENRGNDEREVLVDAAKLLEAFMRDELVCVRTIWMDLDSWVPSVGICRHWCKWSMQYL